MQLKEEFRTYEALRREHDTQIVQIALEAGLRITPDQWSSLLYGYNAHKSHMQSIIDKVHNFMWAVQGSLKMHKSYLHVFTEFHLSFGVCVFTYYVVTTDNEMLV